MVNSSNVFIPIPEQGNKRTIPEVIEAVDKDRSREATRETRIRKSRRTSRKHRGSTRMKLFYATIVLAPAARFL